MMYECHKLQVHIISIAYSNGNPKLSVHTDSHLEDDLSNLASSFTKWTHTLKTYVHSINDWLHKCVPIEEKSSKKKRRVPLPSQQQVLRSKGPPIYTTCGGWLDSLDKLPTKEVTDTIKGLASEVSRFLPRQERMQGRKGAHEGDDPDPELELMLSHREAFEEGNTGYDQFRSSLVIFMSQMSGFAEHSMKMYAKLQTSIEDAKRNYEHKMSQP